MLGTYLYRNYYWFYLIADLSALKFFKYGNKTDIHRFFEEMGNKWASIFGNRVCPIGHMLVASTHSKTLTYDMSYFIKDCRYRGWVRAVSKNWARVSGVGLGILNWKWKCNEATHLRLKSKAITIAISLGQFPSCLFIVIYGILQLRQVAYMYVIYVWQRIDNSEIGHVK